MSFQSHPVSQNTGNLVSFAANCSSTELLCMGSLIQIRFPVFVLRPPRCHQYRDHLPPYGNFLSNLVCRPTRLSTFPHLLRFTLKAFGHCLAMLWPNMFQSCVACLLVTQLLTNADLSGGNVCQMTTLGTAGPGLGH